MQRHGFSHLKLNPKRIYLEDSVYTLDHKLLHKERVIHIRCHGFKGKGGEDCDTLLNFWEVSKEKTWYRRKMLNMRTCCHEVGYRNWADTLNEDTFDLSSIVKISMPELISIIFFLLLLIFYQTIEELRKTLDQFSDQFYNQLFGCNIPIDLH